MGLSTLIKWVGPSLCAQWLTCWLGLDPLTLTTENIHCAESHQVALGLVLPMFWPLKFQEHRRAHLPDSPCFYSQTLLRGESREQAGDSPLVSTWPWFLLTWEETKALASLLGVRGPPEGSLLANGMSFNPRQDPGRRKYRHRPCCGGLWRCGAQQRSLLSEFQANRSCKGPKRGHLTLSSDICMHGAHTGKHQEQGTGCQMMILQ